MVKEIAVILNKITFTRKQSWEIVEWIIKPIQNFEKPKEPVENLRPINLLSMLLRILENLSQEMYMN